MYKKISFAIFVVMMVFVLSSTVAAAGWTRIECDHVNMYDGAVTCVYEFIDGNTHRVWGYGERYCPRCLFTQAYEFDEIEPHSYNYNSSTYCWECDCGDYYSHN